MDKCSIHLLCTHQPRISFVYFDELLCFKKVCSFLTHRPNSTDHSPHLKHVWHQISLFRQTLIATCFQTKITELKVLLFFSTTRHQPGKERLILVSLFAIMAGVYLILLLTFPIHKVLSVFWSISFFRQNVRPVQKVFFVRVGQLLVLGSGFGRRFFRRFVKIVRRRNIIDRQLLFKV